MKGIAENLAGNKGMGNSVGWGLSHLTNSIRTQISLLLLAVFVTAFLICYAYVSVDLESRFLGLEAREAENHIERVAEVISDQIASQSLQIADWADWDDALGFVTAKNPRFQSINLVPAVLESMNLTAIRFYTLDLRYLSGVTRHGPDQEVIERSFDPILKRYPRFFPSFISHDKTSGILQLEGRPYIIAIKGVRGTKGAGSARGYVIFIRHLDEKFTQKVSALTKQNIQLENFSERGKTAEASESNTFEFLHLPDIAFVNYDRSQVETIQGRIVVQDLLKNPLLEFSFPIKREVLAQGRLSIRNLSLVILILLPLLVLTLAVLLHRWVTRPLEYLSAEVSRVDIEDRKEAPHVSVRTNNEIGALARQVNHMLATIYAKNQKLWLQSRDIRMIMEHTKVGLLSITHDLRIHPDYSRHLEIILQERFLADRFLDEVFLQKLVIGADERQRIKSALEFSMNEKLMMFVANSCNLPKEAELELPSAKRITIDLEWSPILDEFGCVERILLGIRDMTETLALRKEAESIANHRNYLIEIIEAGPSNYRRLAQDVRRFLLLLQSDFHWPADLHMQAHTLKSCARLHHLPEISNQLHCLETLLEAHRKNSISPGAMVEEIQRTLALIEAYDQSLAPLLHIDFVASLSEEITHEPLIDYVDVKEVWKRLQSYADHLAKDLSKAGYRFSLQRDIRLAVQRPLLEVLEQSFLHLLNNSIDHGLESPDIRSLKGKPAFGCLKVDFDPHTGSLTLEDDGAGVDIEKLQARLSHTWVKHRTPEEILELLFEDGLSTAESITNISGRGWGLAAVRKLLREHGIEIHLVPVYHNLDVRYLKFRILLELPKSSYQWSETSANAS